MDIDNTWKRYGFFLILGVAIVLLAPDVATAGKLERLVMPGPVVAGHAQYEDQCSLCHKPFSKTTQNDLCLSCHKKVAEDTNKGSGLHGLSREVKGVECKHCHSEHQGRKADIAPLDRDVFDHRVTDFPLKGGHNSVSCTQCHSPNDKYRDAPSKCVDCHRELDPHKESLGTACADCHVEQTWSDTRKSIFSHEKSGFSLKGKHQKAACKTCHPDKRYKGTPKDCFSCHRLNDAHDGRYGKDCKNCHTQEKWTPPIFDHEGTKFVLKGRHAKVDCNACHAGRLYEKKPETTCYGCHKTDDEHRGRYGKDCKNCHTQEKWTPPIFDHDSTKFVLKGTHVRVDCDVCHRGPVYEKKPETTCYGCHKTDDEHEGLLGRACKTCHTQEKWKPSIFDHNGKLERVCYDCHKGDDVHRGQQGEQCETCHTKQGWREKIFFDHDLTKFPLIGLHAIAPCEGCHLTTTYKDTGRECLNCHRSEDEHSGSLGMNCALCHNPNGWSFWLFKHDSQTKFALDGAHEGLECGSCHRKRVKKKIRLPKNCSNCHRDDDIHRGMLGMFCERCHLSTTFSNVKVRQ